MSEYRVTEDPEMEALFREAKTKRLWLHCAYQDLWFSPAELRAEQQKGKFCWGPVNWKVRNPLDEVAYLEKQVEDAREMLRRFKARLEAGNVGTRA